MVLKVYISGMSGNKEVKKRQQRVLMILDSKNIKYEVIDITEPGREADKEFMQNNSTSNGATVSDPEPRHALPPQIFNEEEYCGDYDAFDLANEIDTLEQFLKVAPPVDTTTAEETTSAQQENGEAKPANGEEGENKENEGEQSSEDKGVVKDGEENAENSETAKDSEATNDKDKENENKEDGDESKAKENGDDKKETEEGQKEDGNDDDEDKKTEGEKDEVADDKEHTEEIKQQQQTSMASNKQNDSKHIVDQFIEGEQQAAGN